MHIHKQLQKVTKEAAQSDARNLSHRRQCKILIASTSLYVAEIETDAHCGEHKMIGKGQQMNSYDKKEQKGN